MERDKVKNRLFSRIGSTYSNLVDRGHFLGRPAMEEGWLTRPSFQTRQLENGFEICLDLPGFQKEEITIQLTDGLLVVRAHAWDKASVAANRYPHLNFRPHRQERAFPLPAKVDPERIQATYANGLLTIALPFREEEEGTVPRQIPVA